MRRHVGGPSSEVNVYPSRILFSGILEPKITADLFDARLDLLDVVHGVVSFADDAI